MFHNVILNNKRNINFLFFFLKKKICKRDGVFFFRKMSEDEPARVQRVEPDLPHRALVIAGEVEHADARELALEQLIERQRAAATLAHPLGPALALVRVDRLRRATQRQLHDRVLQRVALAAERRRTGRGAQPVAAP